MYTGYILIHCTWVMKGMYLVEGVIPHILSSHAITKAITSLFTKIYFFFVNATLNALHKLWFLHILQI